MGFERIGVDFLMQDVRNVVIQNRHGWSEK